MNIIAWLLLGLIAGFIGSKIVNKTGEGLIMDIVLGIVGAFVGGFLFNLFGAAGVTGLNIYSLVVAVIGAIVVLLVYHMIFRRRALLDLGRAGIAFRSAQEAMLGQLLSDFRRRVRTLRDISSSASPST